MRTGNLRRSVGWKTYWLFGLGNIIGAGIYVLIGEIAGKSGNGAIWSFIIAAIIAGFTAVSYGALSTRYPLSAGEVVYMLKAFSNRNMALAIGVILLLSGIVSSGVLLNGFANYFSQLIDLPRAVFIISALIFLTIIAIKGIKETTRFAVLITLIEVAGLIVVIVLAILSPGSFESAEQVITSSLDMGIFSILFGSFLAFYAFIGFEDMVKVAEEVRNPQVNIKKGIFAAMISSAVLYIVVAIASLSVVPAEQLAGAEAPLATVFHKASGIEFPLLTVIGLFAIINGILAQIIMSSRILYGMSQEKLIGKWLGYVNYTTKTPINATIATALIILVGAMSLPLVTLAGLTSLGLLVIFSFVHAACLKLRNQLDIKPVFPATGLVLNIGIILIQMGQYF